jgi:hypothetical protein
MAKLQKKDWWGIAGVVVTLLTFLYLLHRSANAAPTVTNGDGTSPDTYYLTGNQPQPGSGSGSGGGLYFGPINVGGGCGCTSTPQATAAEIAANTVTNRALNQMVGSLPGYLQVQLSSNTNYAQPTDTY